MSHFILDPMCLYDLWDKNRGGWEDKTTFYIGKYDVETSQNKAQ